MPTQGLLFNARILSEQQLVDKYNEAFSLLGKKVYMQFAGEGSEFKAEWAIPVETVLSECSYALMQKNPAKYGNILTNVAPIFI